MRLYPLILLLFFASGASALIYEILWLRLLTLVFGNTVQAAATVLAAFMAGLALGALLAGRWLDRSGKNALKVYSLLEIGIAVFAAAFPFFLDASTPLARAVYRDSEGGGSLLVFVRFATTFAFMLIPAALMGATLPTLGKGVVHDNQNIGRRLGALYAVNTFGAVAGTVLCGFWMIPILGTWGTNGTAIAVNLLIGAVAWRLSESFATEVKMPRATNTTLTTSVETDSNLRRGIVLAAYFISGFCALGLEVIWTRVLLMVFGSTTYAFTVMLATFLTGIALGSSLARRWVDKAHALDAWLGTLLLACGTAVAGLSWMVDILPKLYLQELAQFGLTWEADTVAKIIVSVAWMGLPTILFGATFPIVARLEVRGLNSLGQWVGTVYAANTFGAIAGSIVGGFALLPWLGMQRSILVLAILLGAMGAAVLAASRSWHSLCRALCCALLGGSLVAFVVFGKPWDRLRLAEGIYLTPKDFLRGKQIIIEEMISDDRLLYYKEGTTATVAVLLMEGIAKSLRIDGKPEISTLIADKRLGRMMGHLPMLLHPNPKIVLNIGLGGGLTVRGLAAHPVQRVDVAEIEPGVVGAARVFGEENRHVLDDPRVRLIFNDGRNHLLLTRERYDVISSDPLEPVVGGAAALYTVEHFRLARSRLAPSGLLCQYLPLYELDAIQYNSILKSFAKVFPYVSVWWTGDDTILIGSETPLSIDWERLSERAQVPEVWSDLHNVGLSDVYRLLATFITEIGPDHSFPQAVPLNLDTKPFIEFSAPKLRWKATVSSNMEYLLQIKQRLPSIIRFPDTEARQNAEARFRAQQLLMRAILSAQGPARASAIALAREALQLDPDNPWARNILSASHFSDAATAALQKNYAEALHQYQLSSHYQPPSPEPMLGIGWVYFQLRRFEEAESWARRVVELYPESSRALLALAVAQDAQGRTQEAIATLRSLLENYPNYARALVTIAEIKIGQQRYEEAEQYLSRALAQDPLNAHAHLQLARATATTQRSRIARKHLSLAIHYGGHRYAEMASTYPELRLILQQLQ